jgi:thymidylate synthase ThyX
MIASLLSKEDSGWLFARNAARTTSGKKETQNLPSSSYKKRMLLAEHSPIRQLIFRFRWEGIPYWVSTHLVRHKIGVEHFVQSSRSDRTGVDRNELKQSELVNHEILINAQALINISRKRLCTKASPETQQAWKILLEAVKTQEPELYECCVPECIYRGFCPEESSCGYIQTPQAQRSLEKYRFVK